MKIYNNISETVGRTPLLRAQRVKPDNGSELLFKLEFFNPSASVKDRIALSMIDAAEKSGELKPGGTIIEPTSGNTGLGLAMIAAARGYKLLITMPETMSLERRMILEHFGAELVLTPGDQGMTGAVDRASELLRENPDAFMPQQFNNPANPEAHRQGTAEELWLDTDGKIDAFVAGVGTGGTLTGVGEVLKQRNPDVKIIAVEPEDSPVLSQGRAGKHGIQGIGAGFIPEILNQKIFDEVLTVKDSDAIATARRLAREEGIFCGISAGANAWAAIQVAARAEMGGKTVVTIICDTGERYLTTGLFS